MDWLFCMQCQRPIEESIIELWQKKNLGGFPKTCAICLFDAFEELFEEAGLEPLAPRLEKIVNARLAKKYEDEAEDE